MTTNNQNIQSQNKADEHILVCLSASPSNPLIIETAAKMAKTHHASFTAIYVQPTSQNQLDEESQKRIQKHFSLAEKAGANLAILYGNDTAYQIAEYVRLSDVTSIVLGKSLQSKKGFWKRPNITEQLMELVPDIDMYIIPNKQVEASMDYYHYDYLSSLKVSIRDFLITALILVLATLVGTLFHHLGFTESNIITIYILGVILISLFTTGYTNSAISSILSVILFNFFFTEPRLTLHAYASGYPVTFIIMLVTAIITGTLVSKLKDHAKLSAQASFRTQVLYDTNQLLQKAEDYHELIHVTASQLMKLLDRDIVAYPEYDNKLSNGYLFSNDANPSIHEELFTDIERKAAEWTLQNKQRAGATTTHYPDAKCLYFSIRNNNQVYGVIGIHVGKHPLDSFEHNVMLSILGECALAIENNFNAKDKELAAVLAKNEQLRANLLRTISHDLRTPLTSISGNASNLLLNHNKLDETTLRQIFTDIYDDSQWLISLVENLLSVTRIEEGKMQLNLSLHSIDEVIEEALRHINRRNHEHQITSKCIDEMMFAKIDAKLIVQVIMNIVDNAIKYTPKQTKIEIIASSQKEFIQIDIKDEGAGIPDALKPKVFDMFFTGDQKIADSRRSLGLGLSLCKSIINAHGGDIVLLDNKPHGCIFSFTLPKQEVLIDE